MRVVPTVVGLTFACAAALVAQTAPSSVTWDINVTIGPCTLFARGSFRRTYTGSVGSYYVGGLTSEGKCTLQGADSNFTLESGVATVVENSKDDEFILSADNTDSYVKLTSKGSTPMGRRAGDAYVCFYPASAGWDTWQAVIQLGKASEQYQSMSAQQQLQFQAQAGYLSFATAVHCIKGTFTLDKR